MYLLTSDIVAEHVLELLRDASEARRSAGARRADPARRPGVARRLIARVACALSSATDAAASWSDPAIDVRPSSRVIPRSVR